VTGTAAWVARTDSSSIDVGLDRKEALVLARDLIARLREGEVSPAGISFDDGVLDVLHASVEIVAADGAVDADGALEDASRLYGFISAMDWPGPDFSETAELLQACSLWAWRLARRAGKPGVAEAWASHSVVDEMLRFTASHVFRTDPQDFPERSMSSRDGEAAAMRVLEVPIDERLSRATELAMDDPETLLALCGVLRSQWETRPDVVRSDAEFLYLFLKEPKRKIGLFDERDYFLGELALIAGTTCRFLSRREEANRWFDRSESAFRNTMNAIADWARLSYQRLALRAEERRFEEVMELAPALVETFQKLEMGEDALKCRFLEAAVLRETDRLSEAREVYLVICEEAERAGQEKLLASASYNLVQIYSLQGNAQEAIAESRRALPALRRQENRIGMAKLQLGLAFLFRETGKRSEAIETFRAAQSEFHEIAMHADVAAIQLVVADLLLDSGRAAEAEQEILAALPVIEEYKLVSEGVAAFSLLKESVRQRKIDREALRNLHGFFEDSVS
jgi:tetratricopeptide (TPR) repeat protein